MTGPPEEVLRKAVDVLRSSGQPPPGTVYVDSDADRGQVIIRLHLPPKYVAEVAEEGWTVPVASLVLLEWIATTAHPNVAEPLRRALNEMKLPPGFPE